ncbi:MAG: hypothetical protein H6719_35615 [Sandaracinaceae bacterium]|nr:hypothetical protein [Sandaracinaceae bacterium]
MTNAKPTRSLARRGFLRSCGLAAAAATLPLSFSMRRRALAQPRADQKFLFVITASGGGSIIDSFLPIAQSEAPNASAAESLVIYPDAAVERPMGSAIKVVRNLPIEGPFQSRFEQAQLVRNHYRDMCVVTVEGTSVNHVIAQKRAMTGAGIDGGRTLLEAMAMTHGEDLLLPNCNMANGGYLEPGDRADVPARMRSEIIADPVLYSVSTHGYAGLPSAPSADAIEQARGVRDRLDDASAFSRRHAASALRSRYLELRRDVLPQLEGQDLIHRLLMIRSSEAFPLDEYGLGLDAEQNAQLERLLTVFPDLASDQLQAQAALGFLLARNGLTSAVGLGPSFAPNFLPDGRIPDTPIAFDYSHTNHVAAQNVMWSRVSMAIDGLVTLLKETPHGDGSMWDRSLVYVATDFGRTKERPRGSLSFSSGHHLNNGNLFLSPMLKGNRVFGGVDPATCLTYGFDPLTGDPAPGTVMREGHLYSLVAQALGIDFAGRYDMSGLIR